MKVSFVCLRKNYLSGILHRLCVTQANLKKMKTFNLHLEFALFTDNHGSPS